MRLTRTWGKSSYSQGDGNCVEVRLGDADTVLVRDSKNRMGGTLEFDPQTWAAFVRQLRNGDVA